MRLILGKQFEDGHLLCECDVTPNCVVSVVLRLNHCCRFCHPSGDICVKTLTGKMLTLRISLFDTRVREIKQMIQEKEGILVEQQTLVYEKVSCFGNSVSYTDEVLEDGKTLSEYMQYNNDTIHLATPLRLSARDSSGKTIDLKVWSCDFIGTVKQKNSISSDCAVIFEGKHLDDGMNVVESGIQNGSTVDLVHRVQFFVKTLTGKFAIDAWPCDSADRIKAKIQEQEGVPAERQELCFGFLPYRYSFSGQSSQDTVAKCGIHNGSIVGLFEPLFFRSPFPKLLHFLDDPAGSFSDVDFVIPGLDEPLHLHRSVISCASKTLRELLVNKRCDYGVYNEESHQIVWNTDCSEDGKYRSVLVKWLRCCYGDTVSLERSEYVSALVCLNQLQFFEKKDQKNWKQSMEKVLKDYAKEGFNYIEVLEECVKYEQCHTVAIEIMKSLEKGDVGRCLSFLPPCLLDAITTSDQFDFCCKYLTLHPDLSNEEKRRIIEKCDLTKLDPSQLKSLRGLHIFSDAEMLDIYDKVLTPK